MVAPGTAQGVQTGRARAATQVGLRLKLGERTRQLLYDATGLAVAAVMLFPIYWMVATAFKPGHDILSLTPKWIPAPFTLENFQEAIARPYFLDDVKNSVIVVGVMLVLGLTIAFLAAVGTARFGFKGRTAFLVMIIGVQMVPLNALIIPLYLMLDRVGQTDALPVVIAHYLAGFVHDEPRAAVGAAHGRRDADRGSGGCLFPRPPALPGRRADRGSRQGMTSIERLALRCLLPGFQGTSAPDWALRSAALGLGGVVLYGRNVENRAQLTALTAALHGARPELLVAIDEEGGDVTRLEATTGSSYPGNLALGAAGDIALTKEVAGAIGSELNDVGVDLDLAP